MPSKAATGRKLAGIGNGLLNLITHMPPERYRHAIVCLRDRGGSQAQMRERGVEIISLDKRDGADSGRHLRMFRTLRARCSPTWSTPATWPPSKAS